MDNLYAEKFAIGGNDATFSYDGSGINPDAEIEQPMEELSDAQTFEDDVVATRETEDGGVTTQTKPNIPNVEEESGTDYTNILLIGGLLLALFFYKKK